MDKSYHVLKAAEARARKNEKLNNIKNQPCVDCKVSYHYAVMDFDHVRGVKVNDIANLMKNNSWQAVLDEIEKCDLVCSNCHRLRTWNRLNSITGV